jgi:hypothetical protein
MPDVEKSSKAKNDEMQQRMERQGVHHCNHLIKTSERPVQPMSKSLKKPLVKARFQEVECDRFVEKCHIQSHCKQYTFKVLNSISLFP